MPKYPASIDNSSSLPTAIDNFTPVQGSIFNRLRDAVLAIETELGIKPSGIYSNVAARLDVLEDIVGNLQIIEIDEDLGGTLESPLVIGLQGRPLSSAAPAFGQTLVWNGISWSPSDIIGGSGTIFQDLMIPPLTIDFEGTTVVEVSETVNTPAFTATYFFFPSDLIPPSQALLSDNEHAGNQDVSSTPNSFSSINSFTKNTFGASVTFTLTAKVDAITKHADLDVTWGQKLYWGVGPAAQSGASFITGLAGSALTTTKDFAFTVTAGATDKIYFSCRSGYGDVVFTVHDVEGGFTKTGTFLVTNAHGFAENYDLYESDNVNLGFLIIITGEGDDEFIGGGGPVGPQGPPGPAQPPLPVIYEIPFAAGISQTAESTFVRVGARTFDISPYPATIGVLTRIVKFVACADKTPGATSVELQLFDINHAVVVTGTDLVSTNNANTELTATLTVGPASGNLRDDAPTSYELQLKMNGGILGDSVFLTNARLVITYA